MLLLWRGACAALSLAIWNLFLPRTASRVIRHRSVSKTKCTPTGQDLGRRANPTAIATAVAQSNSTWNTSLDSCRRKILRPLSRLLSPAKFVSAPALTHHPQLKKNDTETTVQCTMHKANGARRIRPAPRRTRGQVSRRSSGRTQQWKNVPARLRGTRTERLRNTSTVKKRSKSGQSVTKKQQSESGSTRLAAYSWRCSRTRYILFVCVPLSLAASSRRLRQTRSPNSLGAENL